MKGEEAIAMFAEAREHRYISGERLLLHSRWAWKPARNISFRPAQLWICSALTVNCEQKTTGFADEHLTISCLVEWCL